MAPIPIRRAAAGATALGNALQSLSSRVLSSHTAHAIRSSLSRRQQIVAIPVTYAGINAGPAPGIVVALVLGSVGGVLLVLWLLYTCFNIGGAPPRSSIEDVEVVQRTTRSRSAPSRRRSRSRSEVIEVRSPPRRRERVRETIVMEESRRRDPPPDEEDDIVEVIEEHSPPPRRQSRRVSSSRAPPDDPGPASGFRTVDPDDFAGGDRKLRKVRR